MELRDDELSAIDASWRAANYLTVGQIYLRANPLLREPLAPEHIKPRLLGHWGTSPGLSLVYVHLNPRASPGHAGGPRLGMAAVTELSGAQTTMTDGAQCACSR